ncbi:MAG: UDP-N-acetylmuramate dehydrogenase [Candidatus Nealsonbacteria bacterium]|nr:UDP-N-acetylmuramate dehydrogenase [Candidatus Nealsonbacteria bacterium]
MQANVREKVKEKIPQVQSGVPLCNHTTFRIGGKARYFLETEDKEGIISALRTAKRIGLPFYLLGGGSKVLASDDGFDGLIIKTKNEGLEIKGNEIRVEAGFSLEKLIKIAVADELQGLEWAAGIPGTVGGAVRGNAGAWEGDMSKIVKRVEVFDIKADKKRSFGNQDCHFDYRDSIFKQYPYLVILGCEILLEEGDKEKSEEKIKGYLDYRKQKHPLEFPSAGSIFENPKGEGKENPCNLSAGKIIGDCGLAGKRIGNVKISEKHSNFIVNLGGGKAEEVKQLIKLAKERVKQEFDILLKEELQYLN